MQIVRIPIKSKILYEMYAYAAYAHHIYPNSEIAGWGHYNKEDGIYKLAPLLDQEAHSTEVITDTSALLDKKYDTSDMIVQWHSHCYMQCSPSGEFGDLGNIKKLGKIMPMVLTVIVNLKMEYHAQLDIFKIKDFDLSEQVTIKVELVPYFENDKIYKDVKKHLREKKIIVEEKPVISSSEHHYYGANYGNRYERRGYNLFNDYIPPALPALKVEKESDRKSFNISKSWMLKIIYRHVNYPKDFNVISFKDGLYIQHLPTLTQLTFNLRDGTLVNGVPSTFVDFCKKCSVTLKDEEVPTEEGVIIKPA